MINFDNVTKTYPNQSRPALESVNISVAKGEFVFLVGPSGSGKSTFLRLVLKEERPSDGRIHVAGRDLARLTNWKVPYLRRRIGCVFQDFRLLPNKSVYQNVAFALEVIGKNRRFIRKVVPEVIDLVGLEGKHDRMPDELSGGEQQRVAMARAFVNRPMILLADEPTGNIDPATSIGIMKVLDRINRTGTTVVMATHDAAIVDSMRKRVIELEWRCATLEQVGERIRAVEELHLVPRTRQPSSGLATAVASWARGASFETVLAVAARDVGDLAPGDFVRTVKSVADLVQQVAHASTEPRTADAAREAVAMLLRGVVAAGLPTP